LIFPNFFNLPPILFLYCFDFGLKAFKRNGMQEKDFKFIDNAVKAEEGVRTINLFGGIDEYTAREFISEFNWLVALEPKRIDIRINSAGGSVLHGWSIVDAILTSPVPTRAIVVGVAASMASVVMTAADESFIMDYASVMVHNPFYSNGSKPDVDDPQLATFRAQLIALYTKRWDKTEEEVADLMDGKEGHDGTWFKASDAKKLGIVSTVISTPSQHSNKFFSVSNEVLNSSTAAELMQTKFQEVINNLKETESMKEVIAKLGLEESTSEATVLAKVSALMDELSNLKEVTNTLKVERAGATATIEAANATISEQKTQIESLSAKVAEFEAAKVDAEKARQLEIIENAISEGKINEEQKAVWVELFATSPAQTETVINQLQGVGQKKKLSTQVKPVEADNGQNDEGFKLPSVNGLMDELSVKK
jgi:ATP-dependent protease ClpP protease subunit